MLKKLFENKDFRNFFFYGVIGGVAAIVDFSVFALCVNGFQINQFVANLVSAHLGMLVSFSLNTFLNFKKSDKLLRRFLSYYIIVAAGMAISSFLIWVGTMILPVLVVKAAAIVIVSIVQYLLNRFVTYKF